MEQRQQFHGLRLPGRWATCGKEQGLVKDHLSHNGQMGIQDVELDGSGILQKVIDHAIGARGVDGISTTTSSGTSVAYPLYDAHGSMVSTFAKAGTGYSYSSVRSFDAWGVIRQGSATGDPKGRYCASLGHKQDDESSLIYMRARYYEPDSGRFINEDPAKDAFNWLLYCSGNPISGHDRNGKVGLGDIIGGAADEVAEKFAEVQEGQVALSWAEQTIVKALNAWSEQVAPELCEAFWGEDFLLSGRIGSGGKGIQLTGVSGRFGIAIVIQAGDLIVKTYDAFGKHLIPNIFP